MADKVRFLKHGNQLISRTFRNDRTGNPFFLLANCWIARYANEDQIGAYVNRGVFSGAARFSLGVVVVWCACVRSGSVVWAFASRSGNVLIGPLDIHKLFCMRAARWYN